MPAALPDPLRTVLFDLDGTLVDHFACIHRCVNFAQERLGLPLSTYEKVRATVGGSLHVTLGKLCGEERREEAFAHFFELHEETFLDDVEVLEGAAELLAALRSSGLQTAVFTNKHAPTARAVMAHLGLDAHLDGIFGTGEIPWRKPQPEFAQHALHALGTRAEETVLVGDSPWDVQAARSGKFARVYVVATGTHTAAQLEECGAEGIFADLPELARALFGRELRAAPARG